MIKNEDLKSQQPQEAQNDQMQTPNEQAVSELEKAGRDPQVLKSYEEDVGFDDYSPEELGSVAKGEDMQVTPEVEMEDITTDALSTKMSELLTPEQKMDLEEEHQQTIDDFSKYETPGQFLNEYMKENYGNIPIDFEQTPKEEIIEKRNELLQQSREIVGRMGNKKGSELEPADKAKLDDYAMYAVGTVAEGLMNTAGDIANAMKFLNPNPEANAVFDEADLISQELEEKIPAWGKLATTMVAYVGVYAAVSYVTGGAGASIGKAMLLNALVDAVLHNKDHGNLLDNLGEVFSIDEDSQNLLFEHLMSGEDDSGLEGRIKAGIIGGSFSGIIDVALPLIKGAVTLMKRKYINPDKEVLDVVRKIKAESKNLKKMAKNELQGPYNKKKGLDTTEDALIEAQKEGLGDIETLKAVGAPRSELRGAKTLQKKRGGLQSEVSSTRAAVKGHQFQHQTAMGNKTARISKKYEHRPEGEVVKFVNPLHEMTYYDELAQAVKYHARTSINDSVAKSDKELIGAWKEAMNGNAPLKEKFRETFLSLMHATRNGSVNAKLEATKALRKLRNLLGNEGGFVDLTIPKKTKISAGTGSDDLGITKSVFAKWKANKGNIEGASAEFLEKNPQARARLYEEIQKKVPNKGTVAYDEMRKWTNVAGREIKNKYKVQVSRKLIDKIYAFYKSSGVTPGDVDALDVFNHALSLSKKFSRGSLQQAFEAKLLGDIKAKGFKQFNAQQMKSKAQAEVDESLAVLMDKLEKGAQSAQVLGQMMHHFTNELYISVRNLNRLWAGQYNPGTEKVYYDYFLKTLESLRLAAAGESYAGVMLQMSSKHPIKTAKTAGAKAKPYLDVPPPVERASAQEAVEQAAGKATRPAPQAAGEVAPKAGKAAAGEAAPQAGKEATEQTYLEANLEAGKAVKKEGMDSLGARQAKEYVPTLGGQAGKAARGPVQPRAKSYLEGPEPKAKAKPEARQSLEGAEVKPQAPRAPRDPNQPQAPRAPRDPNQPQAPRAPRDPNQPQAPRAPSAGGLTAGGTRAGGGAGGGGTRVGGGGGGGRSVGASSATSTPSLSKKEQIDDLLKAVGGKHLKDMSVEERLTVQSFIKNLAKDPNNQVFKKIAKTSPNAQSMFKKMVKLSEQVAVLSMLSSPSSKGLAVTASSLESGLRGYSAVVNRSILRFLRASFGGRDEWSKLRVNRVSQYVAGMYDGIMNLPSLTKYISGSESLKDWRRFELNQKTLGGLLEDMDEGIFGNAVTRLSGKIKDSKVTGMQKASLLVQRSLATLADQTVGYRGFQSIDLFTKTVLVPAGIRSKVAGIVQHNLDTIKKYGKGKKPSKVIQEMYEDEMKKFRAGTLTDVAHDVIEEIEVFQAKKHVGSKVLGTDSTSIGGALDVVSKALSGSFNGHAPFLKSLGAFVTVANNLAESLVRRLPVVAFGNPSVRKNWMKGGAHREDIIAEQMTGAQVMLLSSLFTARDNGTIKIIAPRNETERRNALSIHGTFGRQTVIVTKDGTKLQLNKYDTLGGLAQLGILWNTYSPEMKEPDLFLEAMGDFLTHAVVTTGPAEWYSGLWKSIGFFEKANKGEPHTKDFNPLSVNMFQQIQDSKAGVKTKPSRSKQGTLLPGGKRQKETESKMRALWQSTFPKLAASLGMLPADRDEGFVTKPNWSGTYLSYNEGTVRTQLPLGEQLEFISRMVQKPRHNFRSKEGRLDKKALEIATELYDVQLLGEGNINEEKTNIYKLTPSMGYNIKDILPYIIDKRDGSSVLKNIDVTYNTEALDMIDKPFVLNDKMASNLVVYASGKTAYATYRMKQEDGSYKPTQISLNFQKDWQALTDDLVNQSIGSEGFSFIDGSDLGKKVNRLNEHYQMYGATKVEALHNVTNGKDIKKMRGTLAGVLQKRKLEADAKGLPFTGRDIVKIVSNETRKQLQIEAEFTVRDITEKQRIKLSPEEYETQLDVVTNKFYDNYKSDYMAGALAAEFMSLSNDPTLSPSENRAESRKMERLMSAKAVKSINALVSKYDDGARMLFLFNVITKDAGMKEKIEAWVEDFREKSPYDSRQGEDKIDELEEPLRNEVYNSTFGGVKEKEARDYERQEF